MELKEFRSLVEEACRANESLLAFVSCAITYSGRAETFLDRGDRILIVKADQSVLVHQAMGSTPVNYMKSGSEILFEQPDNLIMHVANRKEKAWLDVEIFRVFDVASRKLEDGQQLDLAGNERDMSDWIRDHPSCISSNFKPVSREEQTDVGFIDVFGHEGSGQLVVVECKRVTASLTAVDQLRRYVERVKKIKGTNKVQGVLAAPGITPNAQKMMKSWGFTFCSVEPPKRLERWQKDQRRIFDY